MSNATDTAEQVAVYEGLRTHIVHHAQREHLKGGYEAVGFVAGLVGSDALTSAVPLHNHSPDPNSTFFVEPWEQYRAEKTLETAGFEIRGVYHSHPSTEAQPSKSDESKARPGELMLIYSVAFDELNAWREKEGSLRPVELQFVNPDEPDIT